MKKLWQVWDSKNIDNVLMLGTESSCKEWAKCQKNICVGYACDSNYYPEKGDEWKGKFAEDIEIKVLSVSKKTDTVHAKIIASSFPKTIGKEMDYILSTFNIYYVPSWWVE